MKEPKLQFIDLQTSKCIATGKPAMYFSGHVLAHMHLGPVGHCESTLIPVTITAGWADIQTMDANKPIDQYGCHGYWRPEYGIEVNDD